MPNPNLRRFSLSGLLLVLAGSGLVCGMGFAGGWPWFLFGALALGGVIAVWFGFRWAIYGTGCWPRGVAGRLLFVVLLVIVPAAILVVVRVIGVGIEKQPVWYRPW